MQRGGLVNTTATEGGVVVTGSDPLGQQQRTPAGEMGPEDSAVDEFFRGRRINRDDALLMLSAVNVLLVLYIRLKE